MHVIGVQAGGGGVGQNLGYLDCLGSKGNLGKANFKEICIYICACCCFFFLGRSFLF